jgi:hypothetical protein
LDNSQQNIQGRTFIIDHLFIFYITIFKFYNFNIIVTRSRGTTGDVTQHQFVRHYISIHIPGNWYNCNGLSDWHNLDLYQGFTAVSQVDNILDNSQQNIQGRTFIIDHLFIFYITIFKFYIKLFIYICIYIFVFHFNTLFSYVDNNIPVGLRVLIKL